VLGHRATVAVEPGDVFVIETPGGGGYGTAVSTVPSPRRPRSQGRRRQGAGG
jgi:N-methylhydantoinase B/oxoprolinase/acetone carboxylase alpha subunit